MSMELANRQIKCMRSWDFMFREDKPSRHPGNLDQHFLVIADNMVGVPSKTIAHPSDEP